MDLRQSKREKNARLLPSSCTPVSYQLLPWGKAIWKPLGMGNVLYREKESQGTDLGANNGQSLQKVNC